MSRGNPEIFLGNFIGIFVKRDRSVAKIISFNISWNKKSRLSDSSKSLDSGGAPGGTRTPDLLVRSQTLYPAELLAHGLFSNSLIIISAKRKNVKRFLQVFEILLKRSRRGKGRERFPGFRPAAGFLPPCLSQPLKCSGDGCCG